MCCIETNYDKLLFTNHDILLLSFILPKRSMTKKIAFGNKYYGVMNKKLSFLTIMMYRRFGEKKVKLSPKNTVPRKWFNNVFRLFLLKKDWTIAIRRIMKSEDYIKILDENLSLSMENLDLGCWFTFQQDNDSKYTSKSVTAELQKKKIAVLPMSPDLNPIKNLMARILSFKNYYLARNLQELECVTI